MDTTHNTVLIAITDIFFYTKVRDALLPQGYRLEKARACPELRAWLRAGNAFQVWGWRKVGGRWHVRKVALLAEDLAGVELQSLPRRRRPRRGERQGQLFGDQNP